jgi:Cdc6-like AAA superfamily ATPase
LLDNEVLQNWKTKSTSELLWVHGKHGCGKSYLAARVIQDLIETTDRANEQRRDSGSLVALAYIYCSSLDATKVDPSKLVGSILNQLCHCLPKLEIEKSLENLFDRQLEAPTRQDMQRVIVSIMSKFSETFIVVDGLDECHKLGDDHFEELCEFLNSLVQPKMTNSIAKVLVFSRPEYLGIRNAFEECPKIQVDAGANNDDIKQFIAKKVSGKDLHVDKTRGLPEEVEGTLLSGADGMFLWVDLLIKKH